MPNLSAIDIAGLTAAGTAVITACSSPFAFRMPRALTRRGNRGGNGGLDQHPTGPTPAAPTRGPGPVPEVDDTFPCIEDVLSSWALTDAAPGPDRETA